MKIIKTLLFASAIAWISITSWLTLGCSDSFTSSWYTQIIATDLWSKLDATSACILDEVAEVTSHTTAEHYLNIPILIILITVALSLIFSGGQQKSNPSKNKVRSKAKRRLQSLLVHASELRLDNFSHQILARGIRRLNITSGGDNRDLTFTKDK